MFPKGKQSIEEQFLEQSGRQIAVSGGRPLVWILPSWKRRSLRASSLTPPKKGARASMLCICPGQQGSHDERAALSLLHSLPLAGAHGNATHHRREVREDARRFERYRFDLCKLGSNGSPQNVVDPPRCRATAHRRDDREQCRTRRL